MVAHVDNPWDVLEHDFPHAGTPADKLKFLLNYAVLAPSGYNAQPWRFGITGDEVDLYADRARALPVVDPDDRELVISCGAALHHLCVAIRHYDYEPIVHTFPRFDNPDLLAVARIGPEKEASLLDHRLFAAIKERRTHRLPFEERPVPDAVLEAFEEAVSLDDLRLHVLRAPAQRNELVDLIAEGDVVQGADKRFRRELAAWIHPNHSKSHDGVPGYAQGIGAILSYTGPFVVRTFDWGEGRAARDRQLAEGSPVLLVMSTSADDPVAWLQTGQALSHLLLLAQDYGLSASFLNQPIEVSALRPRVADLIGEGRVPQMILRMGYGRRTRPTPRRPVREVLADSLYG
ncbi:MAG: Acg family FMN-binding oxidoreductase [Rhodothermales bacterium]